MRVSLLSGLLKAVPMIFSIVHMVDKLQTQSELCVSSLTQEEPTELFCASSLFQEHFLEVIQNQEFLLLPTAEIVKLLSNDDINVPDEETIFQALMMWVRYDVQQRQQDLGLLLANIRLPLLPPQVQTHAAYGVQLHTPNLGQIAPGTMKSSNLFCSPAM